MVAAEKCFAGCCQIHTEQNVAVFILKIDCVGIPQAKKMITTFWNKIFGSSLYYIWKEYHGMGEIAKCGKPKSANALEWMGELKKQSKFIDEKDNVTRLCTDERVTNKQLPLELCNWILTPSNWKIIYILESLQMPFRRNKLFYSSM